MHIEGNATSWSEVNADGFELIVGLVAASGSVRLARQIVDVGGCSNPVWLRGTQVTRDASDRVLRVMASAVNAHGLIAIRCMNRRASRCPSCSHLYRGDAFQLAQAGMVGGKGVPESVADHPKVFATLTAPSFGSVHRATDTDNPSDLCRPRRGGPVCGHGKPLGCSARHLKSDSVVGSPLCPACYDYPGQILWNAHASRLWSEFVKALYRHLARHAGVSRRVVRELVRVEYVKMAEYQARGVVHFHAVIRLDGPQNRAEPAPVWASADVLGACVGSAAGSVSVSSTSSELGRVVHRFGVQLDAHEIVCDQADPSIEDARQLKVDQVAGYVSGYVCKGTEDAHGHDGRIESESLIDVVTANEHVRALMHTVWRLGGLAEYAHLNLRYWCHEFGYSGHVTTKSRRYSTTFGALRKARADRHPPVELEFGNGVTPETTWQYVGRGYDDPAVVDLVAAVNEKISANKRAAAKRRRRGEAA